MSLPYVYSLIFFIAFAIYFMMGIYTISLNAKRMLNRLYFVACIALAVWAFCFSIANSAQDAEIALFWRRLASIGWGTVYSILLNFYLIVTERKALLKKKWLYVLLYLPALVNVLAFGLSDAAKGQYT